MTHDKRHLKLTYFFTIQDAKALAKMLKGNPLKASPYPSIVHYIDTPDGFLAQHNIYARVLGKSPPPVEKADIYQCASDPTFRTLTQLPIKWAKNLGGKKWLDEDQLKALETRPPVEIQCQDSNFRVNGGDIHSMVMTYPGDDRKILQVSSLASHTALANLSAKDEIKQHINHWLLRDFLYNAVTKNVLAPMKTLPSKIQP